MSMYLACFVQEGIESIRVDLFNSSEDEDREVQHYSAFVVLCLLRMLSCVCCLCCLVFVAYVVLCLLLMVCYVGGL